MDVAKVANDVTGFLIPFLPYLLKVSEKAVEEVGKQLGRDAWEHAKALWIRLRPRVEANPGALEAVRDAAQAPADEDVQTALRVQLKKLLAEDQTLVGELARQLEAIKAAGIAIAAGERSVAIVGDTSGISIITGDQNKVKAS